MSLSKARQLREQRAKVVADAQALIPADGTALTPEVRTKFDNLMNDAETLKGDIDRIEAAEAAAAEVRGNRPPEQAVSKKLSNDPEERKKQHEAAFRSYMIAGEAGLSVEEREIMREYRDMATGGGNALQGAGGGYLVPVGFSGEIEKAMKWYGGMLQAGRIVPTDSGQPLPWPTDNDTGTVGELVGEGVQVSTADVSLSNLTLNAYKFSTKMVKVSFELLQDSAFDLNSYLQEKFSDRLGRILNTKFTLGTGVNEPKGLIPAASAGPTATGSATNDGSAATGANSIGTQDVDELEHSVDKAYRVGSAFMANDSTVKAFKKLLDKYGRPIWQVGVASAAPDTLNGYPIYTNNDMAAIATTNKTLAFGQLQKYLIRRVRGIYVLRLQERFADYGQVAFIGFARYDGNLLDAGTHPVKYLVQA